MRVRPVGWCRLLSVALGYFPWVQDGVGHGTVGVEGHSVAGASVYDEDIVAPKD